MMNFKRILSICIQFCKRCKRKVKQMNMPQTRIIESPLVCHEKGIVRRVSREHLLARRIIRPWNLLGKFLVFYINFIFLILVNREANTLRSTRTRMRKARRRKKKQVRRWIFIRARKQKEEMFYHLLDSFNHSLNSHRV